jgi:hypothetical protein
MSSPTEHVRRPGGVTLLVVLGIINGIGGIIAGLVLVLDRDDAKLIDRASMSKDQLLWTGILVMIAGAVMVLLSIGLRQGSNIVRWLFGIVAMMSVATGVWGIFGLHGEQQLSSAFQAVFGIVILWILFGSERTDEFFAHS